MKKNIFLKIIIFTGIISLFLIANLSKAAETNYYWYQEKESGDVFGELGIKADVNKVNVGFKDEKTCNDSLGAAKANNLTTTYTSCFLGTNTYVINSIKNKQQLAQQTQPISVSPDKSINEATNKSVYNFLAPIGKIKCMDSTGQNKDCISNNIGEYFNFIFKLAIGLCAALAVVMLIINGVQYMGDESIFGKTEAKNKMIGAIGGLLIALAAWAILNTINPDLTGQSGVKIDAAVVKISSEDTSNGSSTSLCISKTNPPDPNSATGKIVSLNSSMQTYVAEINKISGITTGKKLLATAQANFEGFYPGTKSFRTNNPGNIGNTDDGSTKTFNSLNEGIQAQLNKVVSGKGSYIIGGKYPCALGDEVYDGYLYQYLRIYATGARSSNDYLNAVIGYFQQNGKKITGKTKMTDIYNMN